MIRILQVVTTMDLGGAETLIMNIYRNIDREKVQFDFLCHNRIESKYAQEILDMGGKMYMVPGISHVGPIKYQKNLYNFFKSHPEYKTVHSHVDILSGLILKQAKKANIPNRYSHAHCTYKSKNILKTIMFYIFKSFFTKNVTQPFACAKIAGDTLYRGKLKDNYIFIPNGVDTAQFEYSLSKRQTFRDEQGIDDKIVIGHIGRFMSQKNHHFLVETFSEMLKVNRNLHLLMIGEGELKSQIEDLVKSLGIEENVTFLGARRDIPEFLSAIDLFLFPSLYEGLSVAMVEAQTSGVPILTSTSVSNEAAITDRIKQISLDLSAREWGSVALNLIEENINTNRQFYAECVKKAGFDIKITAKELETLYLNNESEFNEFC